eukprot:scaffold10153_cov111-Isochrysis_galbana.AAC.2
MELLGWRGCLGNVYSKRGFELAGCATTRALLSVPGAGRGAAPPATRVAAPLPLACMTGLLKPPPVPLPALHLDPQPPLPSPAYACLATVPPPASAPQ